MSRQTELMAMTVSTGPKRFRFYLQNASKGLLLLQHAPDGWEKARFKIDRDPKYYGLFNTMSVNELTFRKDARDYIRDVYEGQGINALITFTVQRLNSSHAYADYYVGKIDLATYRIEETGVKVGIIDSSLSEKIKNRENLKVNIRSRESVEGFMIPAFTDEDPMLEFPEYLIQATAGWTLDTGDFDSTDANHFCPLLLSTNEFDEAQSQTITGTDPMFLTSSDDRDIRMTGSLTGEVTWGAEVIHTRFYIDLWVNGAVVKSWLSEGDDFATSCVFSADIDESFTVNTGEDFSLRGRAIDYGETVLIEYDTASVEVREDISQVDASTGIAYPFYEALLRVLQKISDSNDCLKSDYFGRTDTPVVTYGSDGQLGHITKGMFIRQTYALNDTMALSLTELFDALNKVFMLGLGVEDVSGTTKVVVESLDYFFDSNVVLDLSAKLRSNAIAKEVAQDWIYTRIKCGYNSFEYDPTLVARGTLAEFNTKSEFSTVISALDRELDLVVKYRGDTSGIIDLRSAGPTAEGVKGDEDMFIIDSVRQVGAPYWLARTDEDFTSVTGGIDADNWYNLAWTPKRILLAHGMKIRAILEHYLNTYLRWQQTDKNTLLATQLTTESDPVEENAHVRANTLNEPMWWPETYDVELDFDNDDLEAILDNPKGLIKIATDKYGWIISLEAGSRERKANMKLLRANLNYITPVE